MFSIGVGLLMLHGFSNIPTFGGYHLRVFMIMMVYNINYFFKKKGTSFPMLPLCTIEDFKRVNPDFVENDKD